MLKRLIFILILYLISACEISDVRLKIKNKASYPIYYLYSQGLTLNNLERVSLLSDANNNLSDTSYADYVSTNSTATVATYNMRWEDYIKKTPGEKVTFFFFPADTLKKYNWEEIVQGKRYSGKKSYTIKELEKSNWVITYPANNK